MDEQTDSELLAMIAGGSGSAPSEWALRELVQRHSPWLLVRLRRRTSDPELAQEALHDTFVAVWKRPGAFRGEGDIGAWLWGIAIRQLITRLRKRAAPTPVTARVLRALSPSVRSAEDELLLAVEHGPLGQALASLSPELRQALLVTVVDGLSTREAADLLGLPQGTVKSRVRAAKSTLRERLLPVEGW